MQKKEQILRLLEKNKITVQEALILLDKVGTEDPTVQHNNPVPAKTYKELLDEIADEVLADPKFKLDQVFDIMIETGWQDNNSVVTKEKIRQTIKRNIVEALDYMVRSVECGGDYYGKSECGGFYCDCYIKDGDETDTVLIEVGFVSHHIFRSTNINTLLRAPK